MSTKPYYYNDIIGPTVGTESVEDEYETKEEEDTKDNGDPDIPTKGP